MIFIIGLGLVVIAELSRGEFPPKWQRRINVAGIVCLALVMVL